MLKKEYGFELHCVRRIIGLAPTTNRTAVQKHMTNDIATYRPYPAKTTSHRSSELFSLHYECRTSLPCHILRTPKTVSFTDVFFP